MKLWVDRINTFLKYKDLLFQLVSRDIKLKYRRSFLGYLWSVLNPLFVMIIMTIVFSTNVQPQNRKLSGIFIYRKNAV